jgi:hypothetical protein
MPVHFVPAIFDRISPPESKLPGVFPAMIATGVLATQKSHFRLDLAKIFHH